MTKSRGIYRRHPFARVMERIVRDPDTDCFVWQGPVNHSGYARIYDHRIRRYVSIHRLAWETANGTAIPAGLHIDHLCRNRACCNPEHLEPVTPGDNLLRGETFNADNVAKTHCPKGHEYTPDNTYHRPDRPGRMCRACTAEAGRRYLARKRAR